MRFHGRRKKKNATNNIVQRDSGKFICGFVVLHYGVMWTYFLDSHFESSMYVNMDDNQQVKKLKSEMTQTDDNMSKKKNKSRGENMVLKFRWW